MKPVILDQLFNCIEYAELIEHLPRNLRRLEFNEGMSRYIYSSDYLTSVGKKLEPKAREVFGSSTLKCSYVLYSRYVDNGSLIMHKDDNACTYTIDFCSRQTSPWGLIIENEEYLLEENQAVCFLGNAQEHGREDDTFPKGGFVEMIFFHYVEPDHWYFTKGPEYLLNIRNQNDVQKLQY
jgi:hypothetical protein